MKKVLVILFAVGSLLAVCLVVVAVLGFVAYRNLKPAVDRREIPETVGDFKLRRMLPAEGNIWGTETRYFTEYETERQNTKPAITYALRKFSKESAAVADFTSHQCGPQQTENRGVLKNKNGTEVGYFRYCDRILFFRNGTRSVTIFNFVLGKDEYASVDVIADFAKNLPYNRELDQTSFSPAYALPNADISGSEPVPAGEVLSAFFLAQKHKESNESVERYNGKEITVKGYIRIAPSLAQGGPGERGLVMLGEKNVGTEDTYTMLNCWFEMGAQHRFAALERDQYITVRGVFDGRHSADLNVCRLASAG